MKKMLIIALCFMASIKANSQVVDTTLTDCIAAKLSTPIVLTAWDGTKETITHFAFMGEYSKKSSRTVTVALRSVTQNYVVKDLVYDKLKFYKRDITDDALLKKLMDDFNSQNKTNFKFSTK